MQRTTHTPSGLFEALESRRLLSAELTPGGELILTGTAGPDSIVVEQGPANGQVAVSGVDGVADGEVFTGVSSITMRLLGGPDRGEVRGTLLDAAGNDIGALMKGGPGADDLFGGDGDDSLNGGGGQDFIRGGAGDDVLKGNTANDTIFGGAGNDRLVGGSGLDTLIGEDGDDRLLGNTQADTLTGGPGNDRLIGGNSADSMNGGDGDDRMEGRKGPDLMLGGAGNDLMLGLNGNDTLFGEDGDDELRGNAQGDELNGGAGNDILLGGAGPDILFGGLGEDDITGGRGSDNFRARFSERQDFRAQDEFFTEDAGNGEDFALIDDAFWDEIERVENLGLFNAQIWTGIDATQEIVAHCGDEERALENAIEGLSDQEGQVILARVEPLVIDLLFDIGPSFENLTAQRITQFFNEMQALDLGPLEAPYAQFVSCLGDHQEALTDFAGAFIEFGELGVLDPVFRDGFMDLIVNLF